MKVSGINKIIMPIHYRDNEIMDNGAKEETRTSCTLICM